MDVVIEFIISLIYELNYGPVINKRRNYKKKLDIYKELIGGEEKAYKSYVMHEINLLKVKPHSEGIPTYAIFEKCRNKTRVFVLNEQLQFIYRLENYDSVSSSFYIKLD